MVGSIVASIVTSGCMVGGSEPNALEEGIMVWYHIGCEVDSNGDVEGATVMTDLRDWVGGDILDQERVWKESVMGRTVKHTQWKIWIKGHSVSTAP